MSIALRIYYDFSSPFCYAGRAVVARLRETWPLVVEWLPFEIIDYLPPKGANPQNPAFVRRGERQRALRLAEQYGLTMHLRERLLNTNLALCAVEQVRATTEGDADAVDRLHGALFDAYYRDQRDIADLGVVLDVSREQSLDAGMEAALSDGRHRVKVARSRAEAHANGVVSVPTWLAGGYAVVGVPELAAFERLLETARAAGG